MKPESNRVPGLDIFRSIAILLVLACHFSLCGVMTGPMTENIRFWLGILGVQLFFVLSGFLIGSILIRDLSARGVGFQQVRHFWARRWFRTLPNYYVYFVLTLMIPGTWNNQA